MESRRWLAEGARLNRLGVEPRGEFALTIMVSVLVPVRLTCVVKGRVGIV